MEKILEKAKKKTNFLFHLSDEEIEKVIEFYTQVIKVLKQRIKDTEGAEDSGTLLYPELLIRGAIRSLGLDNEVVEDASVLNKKRFLYKDFCLLEIDRMIIIEEEGEPTSLSKINIELQLWLE